MKTEQQIKTDFIHYFDGTSWSLPKHKGLDTYRMGVCKLEYEDNILTVHLRKPGLLIGKGGKIIDDLSEYLGCEVRVKEINLLK